MSQNNFSNLTRYVWTASWGTFGNLGLAGKVEPALKLVKDPIRTGTTGKIVLGHRVVDVEGTVKFVAREITGGNAGLILAMVPWNGTSVPGGGMVLAPPMNVDLFTYAQTLRLHPIGVGDTSMDLVLINAVPVGGFAPSRDGQKDDEWELDFQPYPSRSGLATSPTAATWGTLGGA